MTIDWFFEKFLKQPWLTTKRPHVFPSVILEQDAVRFWMQVDKNETDDPEKADCWVWRGATNTHGYGAFRPKNSGISVPAHQFALYDVGRDSPGDEYEVDHICSNTSCVNPEHLEWVTHQENIARGHARRIRDHRHKQALLNEKS